MLKSRFALTRLIRLASSLPCEVAEPAASHGWSAWSRAEDERLVALAEACNEFHGAGTHWVERDLRLPGEDRSRTRPRMFEVRLAYRFHDDTEDRVRGATPWSPDVVANRRTLDMFLSAACDACPEAMHWIERRVA